MERESSNQEVDYPHNFKMFSDVANFLDPRTFVLDGQGYEMIFVHSSGGIVWRHELVDISSSDYRLVLEIAIDKAECGCIVQILPVINEGDPLRLTVFAGAKNR